MSANLSVNLQLLTCKVNRLSVQCLGLSSVVGVCTALSPQDSMVRTLEIN